MYAKPAVWKAKWGELEVTEPDLPGPCQRCVRMYAAKRNLSIPLEPSPDNLRVLYTADHWAKKCPRTSSVLTLCRSFVL